MNVAFDLNVDVECIDYGKVAVRKLFTYPGIIVHHISSTHINMFTVCRRKIFCTRTVLNSFFLNPYFGYMTQTIFRL